MTPPFRHELMQKRIFVKSLRRMHNKMELSKGLIELAIFCGWHQRVAKQARQAALNSALKKDEGGRASLTCLAEVCFATKETFLSCLYSLLASKYQDKHGLCLICTH